MSKKQQTTEAPQGVDLATLATHIKDFMRGYGRHDADSLTELENYPQWPAIAQHELDIRVKAKMLRFVALLGEEELQAVIWGRLDIGALAAEVRNELKGEARK